MPEGRDIDSHSWHCEPRASSSAAPMEIAQLSLTNYIHEFGLGQLAVCTCNVADESHTCFNCSNYCSRNRSCLEHIDAFNIVLFLMRVLYCSMSHFYFHQPLDSASIVSSASSVFNTPFANRGFQGSSGGLGGRGHDSTLRCAGRA